ncbi:MAG: leucine-rich repeat domain-containing protein [Bacilli bacterium]|nr:leucine-rich repeat domain-containing protein [Bacilli bacterium]
MRNKKVANVLLFGALIFSCALVGTVPKKEEIRHRLVLEENEYIKCLNPILEVKDGEDAVFTLHLEYLATIDGCSYENYQVEYISDTEALLTLKDVDYSSFVSLTSSYDTLDADDEFEIDDSTVVHTVKISQNPDIILDKNEYSVVHGDRLVIEFDLVKDSFVLSVSYRKYKLIDKGENHYILVLHNIKRDMVVSFKTTRESVSYDPNGGKFKDGLEYLAMPITHSHLRANAVIGSDYMFWPGHYQIGWNTEPDYSGTFISFGSRFNDSVKTLYAQWEKYTEYNSFSYEEGEKDITIVDYHGNDTRVCIPKFINRKMVTSIKEGAFSTAQVDTLIIPDSIKSIENNAFKDSGIQEIYISDNLKCIGEPLFGQQKIKTCHISALNAPVNSGTYYDAFQDKLDYLDMVKDEKKIILFGGSSSRYGYNSETIMQAFPDYKVVNMGVFAYVSAFIQLEVIKNYLRPGDIVLDAPEFDSLDCQFFVDDSFEIRTTYFFESNYDSFALLDLTRVGYPLNNMAVHFQEKAVMPPKSYEIQAKRFDDDMNHYNYDTYNIYGDYTLKRPDNPYDEWISQPICDYTIYSFNDEMFEAYNNVYRELKEDGAELLFTYAPKNIHCLTDVSTEYEINRLHETIVERLECPVISDIWDSLMQGYYFFLIDNHLSDSGVVIRTENVIRDLKNYLSSKE